MFSSTTHLYKILFQFSTKVLKASKDKDIHPYGFDLVPFSYVNDKDIDHKYLVG